MMTEIGGKLFILALLLVVGCLIFWLRKKDQQRAEKRFIDAQREAAEAAHKEREVRREESWGEW